MPNKMAAMKRMRSDSKKHLTNQATLSELKTFQRKLTLLQKIRDEAHRFAITYHRSLKEKKLTRSLLDQVQGIGPRRKTILLRSFASLAELRQTPLDILARLEGMNRSTAERVLKFLKRR